MYEINDILIILIKYFNGITLSMLVIILKCCYFPDNFQIKKMKLFALTLFATAVSALENAAGSESGHHYTQPSRPSHGYYHKPVQRYHPVSSGPRHAPAYSQPQGYQRVQNFVYARRSPSYSTSHHQPHQHHQQPRSRAYNP